MNVIIPFTLETEMHTAGPICASHFISCNVARIANAIYAMRCCCANSVLYSAFLFSLNKELSTYLYYNQFQYNLVERDFYCTLCILLHLGCDWLSMRSAVAGGTFMNEFAPYPMHPIPVRIDHILFCVGFHLREIHTSAS